MSKLLFPIYVLHTYLLQTDIDDIYLASSSNYHSNTSNNNSNTITQLPTSTDLIYTIFTSGLATDLLTRITLCNSKTSKHIANIQVQIN